MVQAIFGATPMHSLSQHRFQPTRQTLLGSLAAGLISSLGCLALVMPDNALADETSDSDQQSASQLIESMSEAMRTLTYEGTFVHAQGSRLTSMHILHAKKEQGEFERLVSLDGEAREVIRKDSLLTCIWPGTKTVVLNKTKPRDLLPRIDASLASSMHYEFVVGSPDRVVGRATHVVNVMPLDEYRYGYRFLIDTQNNMLLRSMLLEGRQNIVEQIIFTHISFPENIDASRFEITSIEGVSADSVSWLEPEEELASAELESQQTEAANKVSFSALPEGYEKVSETYSTSMPTKFGPVSHVMLSDGMASVSVYVEELGNVTPSSASLGSSRMGAMNAFGVRKDGSLITAVGEVPEATVKAIAAATNVNE